LSVHGGLFQTNHSRLARRLLAWRWFGPWATGSIETFIEADLHAARKQGSKSGVDSLLSAHNVPRLQPKRPNGGGEIHFANERSRLSRRKGDGVLLSVRCNPGVSQ